MVSGVVEGRIEERKKRRERERERETRLRERGSREFIRGNGDVEDVEDVGDVGDVGDVAAEPTAEVDTDTVVCSLSFGPL